MDYDLTTSGTGTFTKGIVLPTETSYIQFNAESLTNPPAAGTATAFIFAGTNAVTAGDVAEIYVMDGAGNITQISPHAADSPGWADDTNALPVILRHENRFNGEREWIHLSKLARAVEALTGEKIIYSQPIPAKDRLSWTGEQARLQVEYDARRDAAIVEYNKPIYDETGTNIVSVVNTNIVVPPFADIRQPLPKILKPKVAAIP